MRFPSISENVLLDETKCLDDCKIIDFGLASFYDSGKELSDRKGTIYYMSPQVIKGSYSPKCDVFAIGVLAYVCLAMDAQGRFSINSA